MNKVLLVYEDYTTLKSTETALIKAGFDVIGATNEFSLSERVLAFNPEIVVGFGKSGKVNSMGVGKKLKDMARWQGKVVLILPVGFKPQPQELLKIRVDIILEAPVTMVHLLGVLAKLSGQDELTVIEKFKKEKAEAPTAKANYNVSQRVASSQNTSENEAVRISGKGNFSTSDNDSLRVTGGATEEKSFRISGGRTVDSSTSGSVLDTSLSPEEVDDRLLVTGGEEVKRSVAIDGFEQQDNGSAAHGSFDLSPELPSEPAMRSDFPVDSYEKDQALPRERSVGDGTPVISASGSGAIPEGLDPAEELQEGSPELELLKENARLSIEKAKSGLSERVAKYSEKMAPVEAVPKDSQLTRVEAKKRQKLMAEEWVKEDLEDQDDLRRKFTAGLFKKR